MCPDQIVQSSEPDTRCAVAVILPADRVLALTEKEPLRPVVFLTPDLMTLPLRRWCSSPLAGAVGVDLEPGLPLCRAPEVISDPAEQVPVVRTFFRSLPDVLSSLGVIAGVVGGIVGRTDIHAVVHSHRGRLSTNVSLAEPAGLHLHAERAARSGGGPVPYGQDFPPGPLSDVRPHSWPTTFESTSGSSNTAAFLGFEFPARCRNTCPRLRPRRGHHCPLAMAGAIGRGSISRCLR